MKLFIAFFAYTSIFLTGFAAQASCIDFLRITTNKAIDALHLRSIEQLKQDKIKLKANYQAMVERIAYTEDSREIDKLSKAAHQSQVRYCEVHNQIVDRIGGYNITAMHMDFFGEQFGKSRFQRNREKIPVFYYSWERLKTVKISFKDGRAFYPNGNQITKNFSAEFIMDEAGDIFIVEPYVDRPDAPVKHSSLSQGHPVAAAGLITFEASGRISFLHRLSGHYMPEKKILDQFIDRLNSFGVDLSETTIVWNLRP